MNKHKRITAATICAAASLFTSCESTGGGWSHKGYGPHLLDMLRGDDVMDGVDVDECGAWPAPPSVP